MDQPHLSQSAFDRLAAELEERSGPRRREISERIERARELGDIKENADYDAAKNEQGLNEARVRQLEAMLRDPVIVGSADAAVAGPGTIVSILIEGDDEPQTYLLGSIEERHADLDVLSTSSPIGKALIGKAPGEKGLYTTPKGKEVSVEVVEIRSAG